jgi:hypothetical protein
MDRIQTRTALPAALAALALAACSQAPAPASGGVTTEPEVEVESTELPLPAPTPVAPVDTAPCRHLAAVKQPPNPLTSASDPAYAALKLAGREAIPCLVDAIDSTEPLAEPQSLPGGGEFTQGDLAFFLLVDFGFVDFEQALPADLQAAARERGAFAYFDWIEGPGHRAQLESAVRRQLAAQGTLATKPDVDAPLRR